MLSAVVLDRLARGQLAGHRKASELSRERLSRRHAPAGNEATDAIRRGRGEHPDGHAMVRDLDRLARPHTSDRRG